LAAAYGIPLLVGPIRKGVLGYDKGGDALVQHHTKGQATGRIVSLGIESVADGQMDCCEDHKGREYVRFIKAILVKFEDGKTVGIRRLASDAPKVVFSP
jgi:hypothetical protein